MKRIEISVKNRVAWQTNSMDYICGNGDFVIGFVFDSEWDEHETKTARFIHNGEHTDIVFTGSECEVPKILGAKRMEVGVFAGNLYTSTPALVQCRKSILCDSGAPADPTPDVYAQLMEMMEGFTGVDPETVAKAVNDYMAKNPVKETDPTVPAWAKQPTKPEYTAAEVGAQIADCVVAFSEVDGEWKSDKTFNEVRAAYNEGHTLVGMYSGRRYDFYSDGGGEGFGFIFRVTSSLDYEMIWLWEGDSVQFSSGVINVNFPVLSVNGKTGAVVLTAGDVGALPSNTVIPTVPTKVSAFANDKGYQTEAEVNALINTALGVIENGTY